MSDVWKVTEELKSETKVWTGIYIFDFFFLIIYIGITYLLRSFVHQDIRILYYIFSVFMGIFLTMPSHFNKRRRNYQSILILLKKDNVIYKPIVLRERNTNDNNNS